MVLKKWKKISSELVHENPWWKFMHDTFELPNGGTANYYYGITADAVAVVAVNEEGKILVVRQYKPVFDEFTWELPMGGLKDGVDPIDGARLELREEAKVDAKHLEPVNVFQTANGRLTESMHVFVAYDVFYSPLDHDEQEDFEHDAWTVEELEHHIQSGNFPDGLSLASWYLAKPRVLEILKEKGL